MIKGKIEILGKVIDIILSERYLKSYGESVYLTIGGVGSVMRQVMKQLLEFKNIWIRTQTYTGGSSVNIYFEELNDYELAKSIGRSFEMGSFNGMEYIYEYNKFSNKLLLDNGTEVDCETKFCFVNNHIAWDIEHKRNSVVV